MHLKQRTVVPSYYIWTMYCSTWVLFNDMYLYSFVKWHFVRIPGEIHWCHVKHDVTVLTFSHSHFGHTGLQWGSNILWTVQYLDQGLEKYYRRAWISVLRLSGKYLVYHIKPLIWQLVIRYSEVHVVGIKNIALYSWASVNDRYIW